MKKRSIVPIFLFAMSFSLFSCKKDSVDGSATATYYIKGKKDGTAFNFTTNAQATITASGPVTFFNLIAGGSGIEGFNLGINSSTGAPIVVGAYNENDTNFGVGGVYNPNSTTTVYSAGIQSPTAKPLIVNILTKTSTEVTGTFSGAFYRQSTTGTFYGDYISITEGEFRLQIK